MSIWTSLEPASTTVDPGSTATVRLRLRNTGDVVDEYRCVPVGDLAPYVTVEPPTIRLFPGTTGTVDLTFAPPRTPDAIAGPNPYGVQVIPTEHPEATTVPEGNVTITPFSEVRAELVPHTVKGRFRGRPKLAIDNLGNTKLTASINGSENGDQLSYEILPANVQIEPGRAAFVRATLRPRQIIWFGRKQDRPYKLAIQRSGTKPLDVDGTYVQRGVLPRWLATVFAIFMAIAIVFIMAWFTHKPTVATRATAKVEQAGDIPAPTPTQSLPTPAASVPPPPTPSAPNPDTGNSGGGSGGGGGGGGGAPKKKPDPANAKHVLIKNDGTKLCAELPGRDKGQINGWVIENDCNPTDADNQIWDLEVRYPHGGPNNNSLFQMRNIKDRLCMDLGDMGPRPAGTGLAEFTCDGTKADNQLWWLDKQRDDHYLIRNYASNDLCLKTTQNGPDNQQGTNDDNELMIGQCDIPDAHEWSFIQIPKDS
ncbi:ricin-type beta-trefoil lectin domain protein [Streptomyces sp. NBC_01020]|uniref:RICIN domain-containing protein n=1 Tax=unclassified Streptomyces TaxID=2593676 RepID=UPI002E2280F2|nr:ricin-type beta-trefoil lectin domain protein [Streptomyces sp. NBC_01020]